MSLLLSLTLILASQVATPLDDARIKRLTERAEVVVVAEVAEVEPTSVQQPWSGLVSSWQFVQYNVREVIKGEVPDGKIRVRFMLSEHSLTADESRPRLSPQLFQKRNVHLLFLERDHRSPATDKKQMPWLSWLLYKSFDSDYGAVMDVPAVEAKIRELSSASKDAGAKKRP
jgi:hypothetical protein